MPTIRSLLGRFILTCILCLGGTVAGWADTAAPSPAPSATPAPTPSAEAKALAGQLVAAPDDAARDKLLAAAPRALADSHDLRAALFAAERAASHQGNLAAADVAERYMRRLAEEQHDLPDVYQAELMQALSKVNRGDDEAALRDLKPCRDFFASAGDKRNVAKTLSTEAVIYFHRNDYRRALSLLRQAHDLYVEVDYKVGVLSTLNTMANIFGDQGQAERATQYQQQALALAGDDPFWLMTLYHNIASVYASQEDVANAIVFMEKSAALGEKGVDRHTLGVDLESLAEYYHHDGRDDEAKKGFARSLQIAESQNEKAEQSYCLSGLASVALARGGERLPAGLEQAKRALTLGRESGDATGIRHASVAIGKICRALGRPDEAQAAFLEAIAVIEDTRGHLTGGDQDASTFLFDKLEPYQEMVALLAGENRPAEALAMAERAKARVLVEVLRSPKVDPAAAMTPAERATAKQRAEEIAALNRQVAAARSATPPTPPAQLAELDGKLAAARRARDDAEADFFLAHPELRNRQGPRAGESGLSNAALGGLFADGKTALLEYVVGDKETFLFTVTKAKGAKGEVPPMVSVQRLPLGRAALGTRVNSFRTALAGRSLRWQEGAKALGDDLLAPAWKTCADASRLVIIADGPLWELPFQALAVEEGKPSALIRTLLEARSLSFAPSLTFLAALPAASPSVRPARLLAIGNPALPPAATAIAAKTDAPQAAVSVLMDDETVPLPDAGRQVQTLAALYGPDRSKALVGKEAHEDLFKQLAGDYDILHLATHGFLNNTAPMYSRLLMAQTDLAPDEDGLLEAWEWLPLKLHARLAVLSACETGRGKVGAGEGVLGLSWALFSAGCPAVVVSQWKVDSASNTELMIAFHRHLLAGDAPAEALRQAGLELAKNPEYRHPFYWAPFVVVGANRPVANPRP